MVMVFIVFVRPLLLYDPPLTATGDGVVRGTAATPSYRPSSHWPTKEQPTTLLDKSAIALS